MRQSLLVRGSHTLLAVDGRDTPHESGAITGVAKVMVRCRKSKIVHTRRHSGDFFLETAKMAEYVGLGWLDQSQQVLDHNVRDSSEPALSK